MDDHQIVELYWARSEKAISETENKYGRYCYSIAYHVLHNNEDSEECVNDTWLSAWNSMPEQRPDRLTAFLGRITRNLALDRYEKNHAKKRGSGKTAVVFEEIEEFLPANTDDITDSLALREAIDQFLGSLDKEERVIFVQRYWYFCQVKDIAKMHGLGLSSVKMTLKRTRDKLREHLQKEGIGI